jgi:hypothetical protein
VDYNHDEVHFGPHIATVSTLETRENDSQFFWGVWGQTPKVRLTTKVPGKSPGGPPNAHMVPVDRTVPVLAQMEVKFGRTGTAEHFPTRAEVGKNILLHIQHDLSRR